MSTPEPTPEACPPPLMWQDVRREFLAQSQPHVIESSVGQMSARVLGSGPPLYFLPGFTTPSELYCLLVWLLREDFRCVIVEPLQIGKAVAPPRNPLAFEIDMLQSVADHLGDAAISVFGANFGAAWGLAAAHELPARISKLILLQGFLHRRLSWFERRLAGLCGWSGRTLGDLPGRVWLQMQNHRRWFPPFDATRWQYFLDVTGPMPLKELSRRAAAISRFDLRNTASEITAPTLLLRTEGDGRIAEQCNEELAQLLPQAKSEWLHNTGQLAYLTHPHRLAKLIRAFCAEPALSGVS